LTGFCPDEHEPSTVGATRIMKMLRSLSLAGGAIASLLETRLRLIAAEIEFERMRFIRWFFCCVIGASALGTGILTATILLVLSVGEETRAMVLLIVIALLLSGGALCLAAALRMGTRGRVPFQASAEALKEDCKCLVSLIKK